MLTYIKFFNKSPVMGTKSPQRRTPQLLEAVFEFRTGSRVGCCFGLGKSKGLRFQVLGFWVFLCFLGFFGFFFLFLFGFRGLGFWGFGG